MSITSSATSDEPAIIGHTSAGKEKRPRISVKTRKQAKALQQELLFLQDKYAGSGDLSQLLQTAINAARDLSESSRQRDRDAVLRVLEGWAAVTLEEICDDTGLSHWVVRVILEEFIELKLVVVDTPLDPAPSQGSSALIYKLKHSPAFK